MNIRFILQFSGKITFILMPFIYGFVIAYLINWPYKFFKDKIYEPRLNNKISIKAVNIISLISAYAVAFGILAFLMTIIVPQLVVSIEQFINNFSRYTDSLNTWTDEMSGKFRFSFLPPAQTETVIKNITAYLDKFADKLFPSVFNFTKSFAVGIYNFIIGIIISFYLLGTKDKLINQLKLFVSVYIPKEVLNKTLVILSLTHETFGKFIVGKFIDSSIIGVLCFIGMNILKIPYALLISVVVGITNIIPFFGPFIGAIPCIFILLIVDHIKAFWFAIFILILQQIDGNIIGPKVLGNTVGISGLWIMFSVIIGGGLLGVPGMIIGVPAFAVIYTIIAEAIRNRKNKDIQ